MTKTDKNIENYITTEKLIREVKKLNFQPKIIYKDNYGVITDEINKIIIRHNYDELVIIWNHRYAISTINHNSFIHCQNSNELYELCFRFAATPPKHR